MIPSLVAELQQEAKATRNLLSALPAEHFSWKPHEKSLSAGALAHHIAEIPGGLFQAINEPSFDITKAGPAFQSCQSTEELLAIFDKSLSTATAGLHSMSDEHAKGKWRFMRGEELVMEMPRFSAMRTLIFNHLYHHRGQLSVYLRLLDVPVPSVYGPTADNPM